MVRVYTQPSQVRVYSLCTRAFAQNETEREKCENETCMPRMQSRDRDIEIVDRERERGEEGLGRV